MSKEQLDAMQAAASKRLAEFVNRSAAAHLREWRRKVAISEMYAGDGDGVLRPSEVLMGSWRRISVHHENGAPVLTSERIRRPK